MASHQNHEITAMGKAQEISVIMVPLPSQSHLNRLLQLAALISSYRIPVHFIGSATHNRQAKLRATGLKPKSLAKINFHDFPTPSITSPDNLSDETPQQRLAAAIAYMNFRGPIGALAQEISTKSRRIVIVCDMFVAEAVGDAVLIPNVEFYAFHVLSAVSIFYVMREVMGKQFNVKRDIDINHLPSVKEYLPEQMIQYLASNMPDHYKQRAGDVYNTSRLVEGTFIDYMEMEEISGNGKTQWAVGANLVAKFSSISDTKTRHECLDWLDKQLPKSVIYISFGTNVSFSDEEAAELATGLEQSKQKFIWVLRGADKTDIFSGDDTATRLPEGFEERVRENGIVVRDWAPQMEILAHQSVGGFMSHCGWNSCLESLTMGVPIAAWPMHVDQPINAVLLAEVLKVGVIVREWREGEELVRASVVKNVVERLMATEEGDEIRRRAEELSAAINQSMEEGGGSRKELVDFIAHISR